MSTPGGNLPTKRAGDKDAVGAGASNECSSRSVSMERMMLSGQASPIVPSSACQSAQLRAESPSRKDEHGWIYDEYVTSYSRHRPPVKSEEVWSCRVKGPYDPNFKSDRPPLSEGLQGFIATTFKESGCVLACYSILNRYYNIAQNKYPRTVKNKDVFTSVDTGKDVENFVFISTKLLNPNKLCYEIYEDMLTPERQEAREYAIDIHSLFPVKHTLKVTNRNEIVLKLRPILEAFFNREQHATSFMLLVTCANENPHITKSAVDATVSTLIRGVKHDIVRCYADAFVTFMVFMLSDILCLGIVRDFEKNNEFKLYRLKLPRLQDPVAVLSTDEPLVMQNQGITNETTPSTPHEMTVHSSSDDNETRNTGTTPGETSHETDTNTNGQATVEQKKENEEAARTRVTLTPAIRPDDDSHREPPAPTQTPDVKEQVSIDENDDEEDVSTNFCCCTIM